MATVLDHLEGLEITEAQAEQRGNEFNSLAYLGTGLDFLYRQVKRTEQTVLERIDPSVKVFMAGNAPEFEGISMGLIACAFHWYAVSVCNYVRLVGWLTQREETERAKEYVQRVLPEVYVWRNKVAAHFSITDPRPEDTPADLAKSVMLPISFDDDAFYAGSLTITMRRAGEASTSRQGARWSLTHVHEDLAPRYWPERVATPAE